MDLAVKKIELIEWLARIQDEKIIREIEALKESAAKIAYELRMTKNMNDLQAKIDRSKEDIKSNRIYKHEEVESFFKTKFKK